MMGIGIALLVALALMAASKGPGGGGAPSGDLPEAMKDKLAAALRVLTVDPATGKIVGPVTKEAVQVATATAGELDAAGYHDAAATIRAYATEAATMVTIEKQVEMPGIPPELVEKLNRALQMERDPAKLQAILDALTALQNQTPEVVAAEGMLNALLLQIKTAQETQKTLEAIQAKLDQTPAVPSTYTVRAGDTGEKVALAFTGNKDRWRELLTVNPRLADPTYGIALYTGHVINIPASWQRPSAAA